MRRLVLVAPVVLLALTGCRDGAGGTPAPRTTTPGGTVQHQLDDFESTLDSIESELDVVSTSQRDARDSTRPIRWPGMTG